MEYKSFKVHKLNPFLMIALLIGLVFISLWVLKGVLRILTLAAPILLIAAAIINYRVIIGYGKWLLNSLRTNPLFGIAALVFTLVGFPLVAAYLLFKAINASEKKREYKKLSQKGPFTPYEEVEEDFLDLSDVKSQGKDIEEKYQNLF